MAAGILYIECQHNVYNNNQYNIHAYRHKMCITGKLGLHQYEDS